MVIVTQPCFQVIAGSTSDFVREVVDPIDSVCPRLQLSRDARSEDRQLDLFARVTYELDSVQQVAVARGQHQCVVGVEMGKGKRGDPDIHAFL